MEQNLNLCLPSNKRPLSSPLPVLWKSIDITPDVSELIVFNHKQVFSDLLKHSKLCVLTDGIEDPLIQ